MGLRINTNIAALNAHRNLGVTDTNMSKAMERLSSGYRINRAKDDAAGLAQAQNLRAQGKSLEVASRNTSQANAMLQTAEGGAEQIHSILIRLKELATQAASSNANSNLEDINNEATAIKTEIDRIARSTKYLGDSLLTGYAAKTLQSGLGKYEVNNIAGLDVSGAAAGTYVVTGSTVLYMWDASNSSTSQQVTMASGAQTMNFSTFGVKFTTTADFVVADNGVCAAAAFGVTTGFVVSGSNATFQIGQTNGADFRISFQLDDMRYDAIGTTAGKMISNITLTSLSGAQSAMNWIDVAIDQVNNARADIGALQNRLDYTYANIQTTVENLSAAESSIRDVDMAAEMVTFTKTQILMQAGTAMLGQANTSSQNILSLLGR